jgi:hypothetical protein
MSRVATRRANDGLKHDGELRRGESATELIVICCRVIHEVDLDLKVDPESGGVVVDTQVDIDLSD